MEDVNDDRSTLTIRLDESLLTRFKVVCVKKGKPMSSVVREFIEWYTDKEEKA